MKKEKLIQLISLGGILTAMTVLLQATPVFLPVIGLMLSPFSTLPVAMAALINNYLGVGVFLSSLLILIVVSIQEAAILLFTTGMLGLVFGAMIFRKGVLVTTLSSVIALTIGMMILTYIVAIPGFADITNSYSFLHILIIYLIFSLAYTSIWITCFKRFVNYLKKIKLF